MAADKKQPTAEMIAPGLGDIEKVRDILFGKQVSNIDVQLAELEARFDASVDKLSKKMTAKIASLDKDMQASLDKLNKNLAEEHQGRSDSLQALQKSLDDAEAALQHSISMMEDQTNQDLKALNASLKSTEQELDSDKVGRQSLAVLMDEVASKLRGSSKA